MSEPLVVLTASEVKRLMLEALAEAMGALSASDRPVSPKQLAKLYGVDEKRVREWIADGMPCIRTGDVRGLRIWPDTARAWLEDSCG